MVWWVRVNGWSAVPGADARELADAAAAGDAVAVRAFHRGATELARTIVSVLVVCALGFVICGVAQSGRLLLDPLCAALDDYARLDFIAGLQVVPAELGSERLVWSGVARLVVLQR